MPPASMVRSPYGAMTRSLTGNPSEATSRWWGCVPTGPVVLAFREGCVEEVLGPEFVVFPVGQIPT
jgi:hypothetical protein